MRKQWDSWQSQDVEMWTYKERDEEKIAKIDKNVEGNVERKARKKAKRNAKQGVGKNAI